MTKQTQLLNITNNAKKKLCDLMQLTIDKKNENNIIKIFIKHGGCSGFKFHLEYVKNKNDFDEEIQLNKQFKIYIDAPAIMHIIGTTMDYSQSTFKSGFNFINDKNQTCG